VRFAVADDERSGKTFSYQRRSPLQFNSSNLRHFHFGLRFPDGEELNGRTSAGVAASAGVVLLESTQAPRNK
jgi:hypothetical protein